jgi:hypothetical protein
MVSGRRDRRNRGKIIGFGLRIARFVRAYGMSPSDASRE